MFDIIKRKISGWLWDRGWSYSRRPRILLEYPHGEVEYDDYFEFFLAHYQSRNVHPCFLQIGGFDGVSADELNRWVTREHWRGCIAEPQVAAFELLQKNYIDESQVRLVNAAVGPERGEMPLFRPVDSNGLSPMATLVKEKSKLIWCGEFSSETEMVRVIPFEDLISESGLDVVDILQIDTEGYDLDILKMFDFDKYKPSLVHYENVHLTVEERNEAAALLISKGYKLAVGWTDVTAYDWSEGATS